MRAYSFAVIGTAVRAKKVRDEGVASQAANTACREYGIRHRLEARRRSG
jgi:hypothetical protein